MARVEIENVSKSFGPIDVFSSLNIDINHGEFVALLGPSGCGKSTLLRCIAGLEDLTAGDIRFNESSIVNDAPSDRGAAMVFQSYALYPHKTVAENMGFALRIAKVSPDEIDRQVLEAAETLNITDLLQKKPRQLSGGQRQRVAIGRAIVREPEVFLFDEPLSNLDAELRAKMRIELSRLHGRLDATMIYVTHDQIEAMTMADRIVILDGGQIKQIGTPQDVFDKPNDLFVARFIGSPAMNILELPKYPELTGPLSERYGVRLSEGVSVGVRPEDLEITIDGRTRVAVEFEMSESLGREKLLHGRTSVGEDITVSTRDTTPMDIKTIKSIGVPVERTHLFDASGKRISLRNEGN